MNNAKMTFRFDGRGREIRPNDQAGFSESGQDDMKEPLNTHITEYSHWTEDQPPAERTVYRAVETVEEWGDPFTNYTGTGLTVFPGGLSRQDEQEDNEQRPPGDWYDEELDGHTSWEGVHPGNEEYPYLQSYPAGPKRGSWWKVAGSVTGAIVTGALFGFVVLSLFNQEITVPGFGDKTSAGQPADLSVMGPIEGDTEVEALPEVNLALPEQTYYFLQYGVFSTAEGVQLAQEELQASGVAAARDTMDEKRVYAGVSTDREQAKVLSGQLKSAGVHLILHEITLPASAALQFDGDTKVLERYMAQSAELISLLSSSSASLLSESVAQEQKDEEMKQIEQKHQLWTESASAIRGKWTKDDEADANAMEKAMNSAVEGMAEFNKSGAKTLLWEVQNETMRFIMAEQLLFRGKE